MREAIVINSNSGFITDKRSRERPRVRLSGLHLHDHIAFTLNQIEEVKQTLTDLKPAVEKMGL